MIDSKAKQQFLCDLDRLLESQGFRRRRKDQEWRRQLNAANEFWVHINFGKGVVKPSVGVEYLDLSTLLPKEVAPVTGTMAMLRILAPPSDIYTFDEGGQRVARDLEDFGLPFLSQLTDRAFVIDKLKGNVVTDWPTISYSDRIRLLPLLIANEGQAREACELLKHFACESVGRDQNIPLYPAFAAAFAKRFAC